MKGPKVTGLQYLVVRAFDKQHWLKTWTRLLGAAQWLPLQ